MNTNNLYKSLTQIDEGIKQIGLSALKLFAVNNLTEYRPNTELTINKFKSKDSEKAVGICLDIGRIREFNFFTMNIFLMFKDGSKKSLDNCNASDLFAFVNILEAFARNRDLPGFKIEIDKKKVIFENEDIIITDPAYFVKKIKNKERDETDFGPDYDDYDLLQNNNWVKNELTPEQFYECVKAYHNYKDDYFIYEKKNRFYIDDTDKTDSFQDMSKLGLEHSITNDTLYGDWCCDVVDDDYNHLGIFCADSGTVGVYSLKEVLAYNPDFEKNLQDSPHIATVIPNFTGEVKFEMERVNVSEDEEKEEYEYILSVVGKGSINFKSYQKYF